MLPPFSQVFPENGGSIPESGSTAKRKTSPDGNCSSAAANSLWLPMKGLYFAHGWLYTATKHGNCEAVCHQTAGGK
jgi:hypothetical protein